MSEQISENLYSLEQLSARAKELFAIRGLARRISKGPYATVDSLFVVRFAGAYIDEPEDIENEPMEVVPPAVDRYTLTRSKLIVGRTQYSLKSDKARTPCMTWTVGLSIKPDRGPGTAGPLADWMITDLSAGLMQGEPFNPDRHIIREMPDGTPYIADKQ